MADRPLVCRACKEAMPDIDWNNPCPHWKETPEYVARLEEERARLLTLLKQAHRSVCSLECLAHWKTDEGQKHSELCKEIRKELLA